MLLTYGHSDNDVIKSKLSKRLNKGIEHSLVWVTGT